MPQMEDKAKQYIYERKIPMLFESLMTGLMVHRPMDHVGFLIDCLKQLRQTQDLHWDTFISPDFANKYDNGSRTSRPSSTSSTNSRFSGRDREDRVTPSKKSATLPPVRSGRTPNVDTRPNGKSYSKQRPLPAISSSSSVKKNLMNVVPGYRNIVFVLGGPGSGKGTQCARVMTEFNFTHLSTGDLLRSEVEKGSPIGKELEELMQQGKLVPSRTIVKLLKSAMEETRSSQGFLVDGFPRETDQARIFEEEVGQCVKVINFECSDAVMTKRLVQRGQTSGRVDDNEDTIKRRLATFRQETLPVIEFYSKRNIVCNINAERSVDEVYQDVRKVFRLLLTPKRHYHNVVFVLGGPGSGKGTHCARVVTEFNFSHLSTGDLLRSEVEKGSPIGKELEETMQQGKLVPSETILSLLKNAMMEKGNPPGFLIDGFPRELYQAKLFEEEICECTHVLVFECSDAVMTKRLVQRGQTSGRVDDNEDTIKKRLVTFRQETLPVIDFYEQQDKAKKINSDRSVDEVYSDVRTFFKKLTKPPSSMV